MLFVDVKKTRGAFHLQAHFRMQGAGIVALFGRSGCGKTTLINLLAGLLEADEGRIELDGRLLLDTKTGIRVPPEHRGIGYVFQDARLFPHLDVRGNLDYARRRAAAAETIDLQTVVRLLGLAPLLARRTQQLSGGEKQRVAIARALLTQPRLLLLDEPLASLDASRRDEVLPYLESLRDGLAIPMVYVSHDFDEVWRLATQLVLMENGATRAEGGIGAMSLDPGVRAIVGTEAAGAVIDGVVLGRDAPSGLTRVRVGQGELLVEDAVAEGMRVRVHLLARDLIVAIKEPVGMSVRNRLTGIVTNLTADTDNSDLVGIDIGGVQIVARITRFAAGQLGLSMGTKVWALVKSVSLRGYLARVPM